MPRPPPYAAFPFVHLVPNQAHARRHALCGSYSTRQNTVVRTFYTRPPLAFRPRPPLHRRSAHGASLHGLRGGGLHGRGRRRLGGLHGIRERWLADDLVPEHEEHEAEHGVHDEQEEQEDAHGDVGVFITVVVDIRAAREDRADDQTQHAHHGHHSQEQPNVVRGGQAPHNVRAAHTHGDGAEHRPDDGEAIAPRRVVGLDARRRHASGDESAEDDDLSKKPKDQTRRAA
eukprot:scaffold7326_cov249-Pinguiococcus_pyrenoidosus.AAC.4